MSSEDLVANDIHWYGHKLHYNKKGDRLNSDIEWLLYAQRTNLMLMHYLGWNSFVGKTIHKQDWCCEILGLAVLVIISLDVFKIFVEN